MWKWVNKEIIFIFRNLWNPDENLGTLSYSEVFFEAAGKLYFFTFSFFNCEKFDACAYNGGLFGVDSEIYRRLKFVNIVLAYYFSA